MVSVSIKRVLILLALAFLLSLFLYTNSGPEYTKSAIIAGGMSLFGLLIFFKGGLGKKLIGIDNLRSDVVWGVAFGVSLIVANIAGIFNLLLPPVASFSNVARFVTVVILFPVLEEIVFRGILVSILSQKLSYAFTLIIQGLIFSAYHLIVYSGTSLEMFTFDTLTVVGGSFLSAALFGMAALAVNRKFNNHIVNIIGHMIINFWLVRGSLVIV